MCVREREIVREQQRGRQKEREAERERESQKESAVLVYNQDRKRTSLVQITPAL